MIDRSLLIAAGIIVLVTIALRIFTSLSLKERKIETEIQQILESEEFKVRGRFS